MLLIKTTLKSFKGKGIGLVASEDIKKGTIICCDDFNIDREFHDDLLKERPEYFRALIPFLKKYATYSKEKRVWHLHSDNMRFMNHSTNPNVEWDGSDNWQYVATRNIKSGEEITCNYIEFEDHISFIPAKEKKETMEELFVKNLQSGEKMLSPKTAEMMGYDNWKELYGGLTS